METAPQTTEIQRQSIYPYASLQIQIYWKNSHQKKRPRQLKRILARLAYLSCAKKLDSESAMIQKSVNGQRSLLTNSL